MNEWKKKGVCISKYKNKQEMLILMHKILKVHINTYVW